MSLWPGPKVVAAAFRGIAEVVVCQGQTASGIRSSIPHVVALVGPHGAGVVCERCEQGEPMPNPPASMADGAPRTALLLAGTQGHAVFVLTWLHAFARQHFHKDANA